MEPNHPTRSSRLVPLDMMRGFLIILMALDHTNYHIAGRHSRGEYWGGVFPTYESSLPFLTRFVTHICAPGFFFLLGAGMVLFQISRRNLGWSKKQIRGYLFLRGGVLIAVQLALDLGRVWSTTESASPLWYGGVLSALGAGMIICVLFLELKPIYLALIGTWMMIILEVLTPAPLVWGLNFDQLAGVVLVYGGGTGEYWVNYPILAWIELILFGMVFARLLLRSESKSYRAAVWAGLCLVGAFAIMRMANRFGTIRPLDQDTWMGFFSVVKYPPSIAFVLLTMGLNLILLWFFSKLWPWERSEWNPLLVFGREPLFSYVVHLVIYLALGKLFTPEGTRLEIMYLYWLGGLGVLYFPAKWYGKFKAALPVRSWLRLL